MTSVQFHFEATIPESQFVSISLFFPICERKKRIGDEVISPIQLSQDSFPPRRHPDTVRLVQRRPGTYPGAYLAKHNFTNFIHICKIFSQMCVIFYKFVKNQSYQSLV
jgi:hypothetical protein